ncbi:YesL family protein [Bacillus canaveralius]|uniref:YesL family protein n=1 Tax=Bacillus canaveralius TaxID=1403243 RepID=UPI000F7B69EF|nr:DUF624 domain-containing protein [Bacillus canaveralius]RSK55168.1 DUF624 domain-containing protein [Bacillus canaveralius]
MNNSVLNKLHGLSVWISNLVFINILWLVFTVFGGILLGFFPATTAMVLIIKKLLVEKNEFSIKKEFVRLYKSQFKKSNHLFFPFSLCGFIIVADIRFFSLMDFPYSSFVVYLFYLLLFLLTMLFFYSLIVYSDGIGNKEIYKGSLYILLNNPMTNLYILTGLLLLLFLTAKVTGLFFLFSGSIFSVYLLITVARTVKKINIKSIDINF